MRYEGGHTCSIEQIEENKCTQTGRDQSVLKVLRAKSVFSSFPWFQPHTDPLIRYAGEALRVRRKMVGGWGYGVVEKEEFKDDLHGYVRFRTAVGGGERDRAKAVVGPSICRVCENQRCFAGRHSCTLCGLRRPSKALTGIWLDAVHVSPPTAGGRRGSAGGWK